MVMFIFSVFNQKYPFCLNLVQKIKIVGLSWNLVPTVIRIWRIQWCCSLFSFIDLQVLSKISMLPDQSPISLLSETWSQRLFLFLLVWEACDFSANFSCHVLFCAKVYFNSNPSFLHWQYFCCPFRLCKRYIHQKGFI